MLIKVGVKGEEEGGEVEGELMLGREGGPAEYRELETGLASGT